MRIGDRVKVRDGVAAPYPRSGVIVAIKNGGYLVEHDRSPEHESFGVGVRELGWMPNELELLEGDA